MKRKGVSEVISANLKQIAALNKEKRYFNMSYEQIKAWMGDYELWD